MTYEQALEYITSRGRFGVKLGTERIAALLADLDSPQRGLRGALVAGTNGKGSTCAVLASILQSAGLRVGLMPKPHLVSYTERIQLDGAPIPEAEFAAAVERIAPAIDRVGRELGDPTEFEILTALAISYLAGRVDRLVCEVGMGGRLDATNVLDLGVAVVTNVALDHQQHLGDTVEAIAAEKAAILKPGNVAITGCEGSALEIVEAAAANVGAELWRLGREIDFRASSLGWSGSVLDVDGPGFSHRGLRLQLAGTFQAANAALAVAASHALDQVRDDAVAKGTASTTWPGRLEVVASSPRVVLDGGHNVEGLRRIVSELRQWSPNGRFEVVFGAMRDKDLRGMLKELRGLGPERVFFTRVAYDRAADPEELARLWDGSARVVARPADALSEALEGAGADGTVLVCGSLYLIGELRPQLAAVPA